MTKSIFETKEQYLAFRAAFAAAQNDKRAKHYFTEVEATVWDHATQKYGKMPIKMRNHGWLQAEHFILLNAVRGRPFSNGFTPITKENKIVSNWGDPLHAFTMAHRNLLHAQTVAQRLIGGIEEYKPSAFEARQHEKLSVEERAAIYRQKKLDEIDKCGAVVMRILGPFAGTLTLEQFAALELKVSE